MGVATCPECFAELNLGQNVMVGEVVTCAECSAELAVANVEPIELAVAPGADEDWGE